MCGTLVNVSPGTKDANEALGAAYSDGRGIMVLDYSKTCGACSTPLTSPPRDGPDSMCAYLHTRQGRREFEATLKRNEATKTVIDSVPVVASPPNEATVPDEATLDEDEATTPDIEATELEKRIMGDGTETKSQRYKRLHREEINQQQRDRRNHT